MRSDRQGTNLSMERLRVTPKEICSHIWFHFNSVKKNFNYPTSGNFIVVMAGSKNNEYIKFKEQYNNKHTTPNKRGLTVTIDVVINIEQTDVIIK